MQYVKTKVHAVGAAGKNLSEKRRAESIAAAILQQRKDKENKIK